MQTSGPLAGIKVLEIEGIGPGPHGAMMLAGAGANVLRVTRPGAERRWAHNPVLDRGRAGEVAIDLKSAAGRDRLLALVGEADGLIEGFRPGVMERLRLGPAECLTRRPRLVYGRITGWGQSGPLARTAGHDINFIALTGALHAIGTAESGPVVPVNLLGDFGGGGMLLAFGMVCALLEARRTGRGQVVDASVLDGAANLMAMTYGLYATGEWKDRRARNVLDGGAYFYTCYRCRDGRYVAVGAIEPKFREYLLERLGFARPYDRFFSAAYDDPGIRAELAARFAERGRDEWVRVFDGTDACVSPVLSLAEAPEHPHVRAVQALRSVDGVTQPVAAPRFASIGSAAESPGAPEVAANRTAHSGLDAWDLAGLDVRPAT